jgi:thiol-disulfide isomerase/thioredoxin
MKNFWFIGLFFFFSHSHAQVEAYELGAVVNNFTATDTEGNTFDLYEQCDAGKYVFIKFYLSTCSYCQYITPFFNELYEKYGCNSGDLACVSVNGFADNTGVASFEASYSGGLSHPPTISTDGGSTNIINRFNPNSYPTVCIIAPDRTIVNLNIWPISSVDDLEAAFPEGFFPTVNQCSLSIDDNFNNRFQIFQNIENARLIKINSPNNEKVSVQIFNQVGMLIDRINLDTNTEIISNLPDGIYLFQILASHQIYKQQIIIY